MFNTTAQILIGDCREMLGTLADASVHCCVTSPPYFGLRDYGTGSWEGGDPECEHKVKTGQQGATGQRADRRHTQEAIVRDVCRACGAMRVDRQLGLESTPDEFVAAMVEVFREVRRVLRDDGTVWLNVGDSYNAHPGQRKVDDAAGAKQATSAGSLGAPSRHVDCCKPKDLIGIPWMLAFALRADGWFLRQEIIWHKPNPMPESVTDRCTKSHEQIFLLSKSPRYYFDADAIAETAIHAGAVVHNAGGKNAQMGKFGATRGGFMKDGGVVVKETRNKRSVWTVNTVAFPDAHFATYPPALIEPCILAGCPEGGTVLDPFFGAGTTGLVARRLGRNAIGVELNPEYAEIARRRLEQDEMGEHGRKRARAAAKAASAPAEVGGLFA